MKNETMCFCNKSLLDCFSHFIWGPMVCMTYTKRFTSHCVSVHDLNAALGLLFPQIPVAIRRHSWDCMVFSVPCYPPPISWFPWRDTKSSYAKNLTRAVNSLKSGAKAGGHYPHTTPALSQNLSSLCIFVFPILLGSHPPTLPSVWSYFLTFLSPLTLFDSGNFPIFSLQNTYSYI